MTFIKRSTIEGTAIGSRIRLTSDVEVIAGVFTAGTELTVTGHTERGLDLVDDEGNRLTEFGRLGGSRYTVIR